MQLVSAGFYRDGDWGERMPIPDPEAKPGPDLDWEAFLGDAPKVPFTVDRFFSWRKYLDYAGGPCTDLFPHVFTPFVSAIGLKFPARAVASGGIFKYTTYDREVPDTFNMCLDYPEKLSIVLPCTLANDYPPEAAIRGDEGTLTLQNPGEWNRGFDSVTVVPMKGEPRTFPAEQDRRDAAALAELPQVRAHPGKAGQRRRVRPARAGRPEHGDAELPARRRWRSSIQRRDRSWFSPTPFADLHAAQSSVVPEGLYPVYACGVAMVPPRRLTGVAPMGPDPHGNHTGSPPYPRQHSAIEPPGCKKDQCTKERQGPGARACSRR